jgi:restriction system protein
MARKRSRRSRNPSLSEVLIESDWRISLVLAGVVWIALRHVLPAVAGDRIVLKSVVGALQGIAWLPVTVLCLLACLSFLRTLRYRGVASALPHARPEHAPEVSDVRRRKPVPRTAEAAVLAPSPEPSAADAGATSLDAGLPPAPTRWSLELIRNLEWKRFEDVCQQFYALKGIRSTTTSLGADGGIDIRLYQNDDADHASAVVQCKAWGERQVGVKPVRELLGVKVHEKADKAFVMSSGGYTEEARAFASANGITLIGGDMLLMMFSRLPAEASASLLAFATAGDYLTPTCPSCGVKMTARKGKSGGRSFWGCIRYPRCRQTLPKRST